MNNKGFIATSLIYSFFLIFITLFLTIIADYLQNKVLLNTIESGIKDNINNTKSIEDFEVGDIVTISHAGGGITFNDGTSNEITLAHESMWIVASIIYDNKNTPADDSKLILYKITADLADDTYAVTMDKIKTDLESYGNYNDTILNELILNVNANYTLPSSGTSYIISKECSKIKINETNKDIVDIDSKGSCSTEPTLTNPIYRERIEILEWNDKKITVNPDSFNGITITGEAS